VELHYQCGHGTDCLHGDWRIAESAAAAFGGRVDSFDVEKDGPGLTVRLEATLVGAVRPVVSSRIADAFGHVLAGFRTEQVRYQWLPDGLRRDPTAARSLGIADCVVTSVELAKMLGDAGFDTRTRTVTALGVVGIDHAWTEVLDDDGEWKVLDPVFAYLAVRRPGGRPEFEEFCRGSHGNRSLAWQSGAIEGVADHHCAGPASSIESSITAGAIRHA
jgi:hypothetical protein